MKVLELAERRGFMVVIDDVSPAGPVPRAAAWGEILRYGAFCRELGLPEDAGREEFVLAAYRKWGREFPSHLLGEVSYAVWDPTEGVLIAVSDTAGSRPIYYAAKEGKVAVSTDTRALRALPWVGSKVNDLTVVAFLVRGDPEEDATFYANIKRLPGGHRLVAKRGRVDVRRWWGPFFPADEAIKTQADFVARFRELLFDAVRDRLLLGGPVSIMLSGGFDSTAVAGVAAALSREPGVSLPEIRTISYVFPGLACDESDRIAIMRATLPFEGDVVVCEPRGMSVEEIEARVRLNDSPFFDLQAPADDAGAAVARAAGGKAIMGGFGGDELFWNPSNAADVRRAAGWAGLPRAIGQIARRRKVDPVRAAWAVFTADRPRWMRRSYWEWRFGVGQGRFGHLLEPRWWAEARRREVSVVRQDVEFGSYVAQRRWSLINAEQAQAARARVNAVKLGQGFEFRSPLLDRRLIESVLGTSCNLWPSPTKDTPFKPILVKATHDLVPHALTDRPWKVLFDVYNMAVLRAAVVPIERHLKSTPRWNSVSYLPHAAVLSLAARLSLTNGGVGSIHRYDLVRAVGIEEWLATHHADSRATLGGIDVQVRDR